MADEALSNESSTRLRNYVRRVETLREEIAALNDDVSEVYKEAKSFGLDVPAMKAVIGERAKRAKDPDKFEQLQGWAEAYRAALDDVGPIVAPRVRAPAYEAAE